MNYRLSHRLLWGFATVGLVLCFVAGKLTSLSPVPGAALVVFAMVQGVVFYRCPHCKKSLMGNAALPHRCPYCDTLLQEDEG